MFQVLCFCIGLVLAVSNAESSFYHVTKVVYSSYRIALEIAKGLLVEYLTVHSPRRTGALERSVRTSEHSLQTEQTGFRVRDRPKGDPFKGRPFFEPTEGIVSVRFP